jgi:hypothetical protein
MTLLATAKQQRAHDKCLHSLVIQYTVDWPVSAHRVCAFYQYHMRSPIQTSRQLRDIH